MRLSRRGVGSGCARLHEGGGLVWVVAAAVAQDEDAAEEERAAAERAHEEVHVERGLHRNVGDDVAVGQVAARRTKTRLERASTKRTVRNVQRRLLVQRTLYVPVPVPVPVQARVSAVSKVQ